jgi:hypothetical protein
VVDTETRGRRPGRCEIVQATLSPGNLTVVAARARPEVLTDVRMRDRAVGRRLRATFCSSLALTVWFL